MSDTSTGVLPSIATMQHDGKGKIMSACGVHAQLHFRLFLPPPPETIVHVGISLPHAMVGVRVHHGGVFYSPGCALSGKATHMGRGGGMRIGHAAKMCSLQTSETAISWSRQIQMKWWWWGQIAHDLPYRIIGETFISRYLRFSASNSNGFP